ncbi:MAG: 5-methyltetrahydropteroyltriglutamate--homocysteine S-methyltransferase [Solibacillus sp.]
MKTAIIGYPYIGRNHEWKMIIEDFCKGKLTEQEFYLHMQELHFNHVAKQHVAEIDVLTIGDFTYYDRMLDLAWMFNLVPKRFGHLTGVDAYFAMARGEESCRSSKWFTTNYHYVVPEFDGQSVHLVHNPFVEQVVQVKKRFGKTPRVTLIGPYTFIQLTKGITKETHSLFVKQMIAVYRQLLIALQEVGVEWVQLEEPALTKDLRKVDLVVMQEIYKQMPKELSVKVMLTTYFEGVQKLREFTKLPVAGVGIDFTLGYEENMEQLSLLQFPKNKVLALGIIDGQNIWRANLADAVDKITRATQLCRPQEIWLQSSCHLQHVPITKEGETQLFSELYEALSFADEKLAELVLLKNITEQQSVLNLLKMNENKQQLQKLLAHPSRKKLHVETQLAKMEQKDFKRASSCTRRKRLQQLFLELPNYPTTIVNGFPQSEKMQRLRVLWQRGELTKEQYEEGKKQEIERHILLQQKIGLDVFLYEQVERASMVELLADKLEGMALTQRGWVASHGTHCNKPPILYGDVDWTGPIVVQDTKLAQKKTCKPLKCKLTGPTTLFNWSFVRDDIAQQQVLMQLALALRTEIKALEGVGVYIIQVDEPALVETLPLRKQKQRASIQHSIEAFKLATAVVRDTTQIHANLSYCECKNFKKVIGAIDVDVLLVEASNQEPLFLAHLQQNAYKFGIGFGVGEAIQNMATRENLIDVLKSRSLLVAKEQFWITPDIGYPKKSEEEKVTMLTKVIETVSKMKKYY